MARDHSRWRVCAGARLADDAGVACARKGGTTIAWTSTGSSPRLSSAAGHPDPSCDHPARPCRAQAVLIAGIAATAEVSRLPEPAWRRALRGRRRARRELHRSIDVASVCNRAATAAAKKLAMQRRSCAGSADALQQIAVPGGKWPDVLC